MSDDTRQEAADELARAIQVGRTDLTDAVDAITRHVLAALRTPGGDEGDRTEDGLEHDSTSDSRLIVDPEDLALAENRRFAESRRAPSDAAPDVPGEGDVHECPECEGVCRCDWEDDWCVHDCASEAVRLRTALAAREADAPEPDPFRLTKDDIEAAGYSASDPEAWAFAAIIRNRIAGRLAARPPAVEWSSTPPSVVGWYLYRGYEGPTPSVVRVEAGHGRLWVPDGDGVADLGDRVEWAGPFGGPESVEATAVANCIECDGDGYADPHVRCRACRGTGRMRPDSLRGLIADLRDDGSLVGLAGAEVLEEALLPLLLAPAVDTALDAQPEGERIEGWIYRHPRNEGTWFDRNGGGIYDKPATLIIHATPSSEAEDDEGEWIHGYREWQAKQRAIKGDGA